MIDFVLNKNLIKYSKDFGFSNIYCIDDLRVVEGKNEKINRKAVEDKNNNLLYGLEKFGIKDKIHYRDSGLNQVLCKLAKKNNVKIGFSFSDVLNSNEEKSVILGRMVQNVKLCNKYKVDMIIGSFAKSKYEMKSGKDLVAFGKLIGMKKIWNEKIDSFFKDEGLMLKRIK
ncbi:MAG: hypothetical protein CMH64_01285 [Nanoarchaeota archaeon]|nr:hypothetical protein [Nanoarchaeota archaeon]|tara:strand:- start:536 stop:1048 length:513 start_codon:yes stop_codon:yes gene_type:complete